jgi:NAD(P)-dependent dehydrogenase (short-subunit alcohol dehydrogenase family)
MPVLERQSVSWTVGVILIIAVLAIRIPSDDAFRQSDLSELARNLTLVITGANSGLGYGTVEHLARAGTAKTVVLACRSPIRCKAAKANAAALLPPQSTTQLLTIDLDLASRSSIEGFPDELSKLLAPENSTDVDIASGRVVIDVLINNAGIFASSVDLKFVHGVEEHMHVNYLGHVLLTHLLWPSLERSKARIVSVSSISALLPTNPLAGWYDSDRQWSEAFSFTSGLFRYLRSKRANLVFAQELHRRMRPSGVADEGGVSSVASHPGYTRSEIWSNGAKCLPSFYAKLIQSNPFFSMSSSDGALTQLWAALDRTGLPCGSYVGPRWWLHGKPVALGAIDKPSFPFHYAPLFNEDSLWERTMNELGIQTFGRP